MHSFTRRQFIKGSLAMAGYACCSAAFGQLGARVAYAQSQAGNGNIFVLGHLDGGMDWHVSLDIPKNAAARAAFQSTHPTSACAVNSILATADGYGFHPQLAGLHAEFLQGNVRVIRRAGTNDPSRSHENEQLKFANGDIDVNGLGWIGRVMDAAAKQGGQLSRFMTMAIDSGNPIDIQGAEQRGLGVRDLTSYSLDAQYSTNDQLYRQFISRRVLDRTGDSVSLVDSARDGQKAMYASIQTLRQASQSFTGRPLSNNPVRGVHYPTRRPGPQLRQIAMLIRAGVGTQLALFGMGGFDMHSELGAESGLMAQLLRDLDLSIAAFRNDMVDAGKWNNVVLAIDTEFGRTIQENASLGTDHGEAMAQVLVGGAINGGVSGRGITGDEFLRNNRRPNWVTPQYHYANAYEEVLKWLGLPSSKIFGPHSVTNFGLFS